MNGGITYKDMEERKVALARAEKAEAEALRLRELLIQAGLTIAALQPTRRAGGILDRINIAITEASGRNAD